MLKRQSIGGLQDGILSHRRPATVPSGHPACTRQRNVLSATTLWITATAIATTSCAIPSPTQQGTDTPSNQASISGGQNGGVSATNGTSTGGTTGSLTANQNAALDACETATGQRSFDNCPVPVLCSALSSNSAVPITVDFPALTGTCPWNQNENLSQEEGISRARVEQVRDLAPSLNTGSQNRAVFCSVDIRVEPTDPSGLLRYDDDLLFVFGGNSETSGTRGGALLVTRNRDVPGALLADVPELNGTRWPLYDWTKVRNIELSNNQSGLYCLGHGALAQNDPNTCSLPETQQSGAFVVKLQDSTAKALGVRAALTNNYELTAVLTGDNDPDNDCRHNGFRATVNVSYVELPAEQAASIGLE